MTPEEVVADMERRYGLVAADLVVYERKVAAQAREIARLTADRADLMRVNCELAEILRLAAIAIAEPGMEPLPEVLAWRERPGGGAHNGGSALMGLRTKTEDRVSEDAEQAWLDGLQAFVWLVRSGMKNLDGRRLAEGIDVAMRIGWTLHSTALLENTTGLNQEVAMVTFVR